MKYFTLDWYHRIHEYNDDDQEYERTAFERYKRHLDEMQTVLPAEVLELARLRGVDDGLVVEVQHDRNQCVLTLTLRCGDAPAGYYDLILRYAGATISLQDEQTLALVARTTKSERYHESDVAFHELCRAEDGHIEHRFLFHPGREFTIRCQELHWEKISRPNRMLPRILDRFPGGPSEEGSEREDRWVD